MLELFDISIINKYISDGLYGMAREYIYSFIDNKLDGKVNEEVRNYIYYVELMEEHYVYMAMEIRNKMYTDIIQLRSSKNFEDEIDNYFLKTKKNTIEVVQLEHKELMEYRLKVLETLILAKEGLIEKSKKKYLKEIIQNTKYQTVVTYIAFTMITVKIRSYDELEKLLRNILNGKYNDDLYEKDKLPKQLNHTLAFMIGLIQINKPDCLMGYMKKLDNFIKKNNLELDYKSIINK